MRRVERGTVAVVDVFQNWKATLTHWEEATCSCAIGKSYFAVCIFSELSCLSISFFIIRFKRVTIRDRHSCVLHNDERNDVIRSSYYEFRSSLRSFFFFFFSRPSFFAFSPVKRCLQIHTHAKCYLNFVWFAKKLTGSLILSSFAYLKSRWINHRIILAR